MNIDTDIMADWIIHVTAKFTVRVGITYNFLSRDVSAAEWMEWYKHAAYAIGEGEPVTVPMPVSLTNSYNSVYGSPYVNGWFRAWHDAIHAIGGHSFSYADEKIVAKKQIQMLGSMGAPKWVLDVIEADTIGQLAYHKYTGEYPENQLLFATRYIEEGYFWINGDLV